MKQFASCCLLDGSRLSSPLPRLVFFSIFFASLSVCIILSVSFSLCIIISLSLARSLSGPFSSRFCIPKCAAFHVVTIIGQAYICCTLPWATFPLRLIAVFLYFDQLYHHRAFVFLTRATVRS